jgi:hypothetical protein
MRCPCGFSKTDMGANIRDWRELGMVDFVSWSYEDFQFKPELAFDLQYTNTGPEPTL